MLATHETLLRSISLFRELSQDELAKVGTLAQVRHYESRAEVVTQGEPARALFAILRGRLKVVSSGPDGGDTVLNIMAEGEVFGEIALIDGGQRSATCTALEPCELLSIQREQFLELVERCPSIAIKLLRVLATRVRHLSQRSEDTASLDVATRLARAVLDLAARFGQRRASGDVSVLLKLSQQELGDLIDATRESVNKHLGDWIRQGMLQTEDGFMRILDLRALRQTARLPDDMK
jgi:CRP/FNR family transcriptional regulator, cyclic AMP receptor protein